MSDEIEQNSEEHILVIGPAWVGDMVMAQSLFITLKQRNPQCKISVMAPLWTSPLLQRMPEVDHSLDAQLGHGELKLGARRKIGRSLRSSQFSQAIVLPNSFKSALIPFHAGIPTRTGWKGEWRSPLLNDCRILDKQALPRMVERFTALAYPNNTFSDQDVPAPKLSVKESLVHSTAAEFGLNPGGKILAICPGAEFGEAKQWPAKHYADLINALANSGWEAWFFGSANDQLICESILADIEPEHLAVCKNLAGKTTLAQAIDLMSCASAVVSNDSGLMHVGAALEKPVVGIYGSTSPDFTPPLAERVKLLSTDIECRPCFKRQCPYGHLKCLTELHPQLAIDAVNRLVPEY